MVDGGADGRRLRGECARDAPLLGADQVGQQRLGVAERVLERRRVAEPLAQALHDRPLRGGGVRRRVTEQRGQRGAHARPRQHGVHGQLAQADPQLDLLEREAPVVGEAGHVARHEKEGRGLGPGKGERVLPEGAARQMARGGAELHAQEDRSERQGELPEQAAEPVAAVGVELAQVHGRQAPTRRPAVAPPPSP